MYVENAKIKALMEEKIKTSFIIGSFDTFIQNLIYSYT